MLICPPCDDKPATGTNALASMYVFNDIHQNGSDIKGLHVKVKNVRGPSCLSMQYEYGI